MKAFNEKKWEAKYKIKVAVVLAQHTLCHGWLLFTFPAPSHFYMQGLYIPFHDFMVWLPVSSPWKSLHPSLLANFCSQLQENQRLSFSVLGMYFNLTRVITYLHPPPLPKYELHWNRNDIGSRSHSQTLHSTKHKAGTSCLFGGAKWKCFYLFFKYLGKQCIALKKLSNNFYIWI